MISNSNWFLLAMDNERFLGGNFFVDRSDLVPKCKLIKSSKRSLPQLFCFDYRRVVSFAISQRAEISTDTPVLCPVESNQIR